MKKDSIGAFYWIINLLRSKKIPFLISGGLAVRAYGATRRLVDIDIEIYKRHFSTIFRESKPYVTSGPKRYRDEKWDVFLMTLRFHAQKIDLSATDNASVFDTKRKKWEKLPSNLKHYTSKMVFGLKVPVENRQELIAYKRKLGRGVDIRDIHALEKINSNK